MAPPASEILERTRCGNKKKELSNETRLTIFSMLLMRFKDGVLERGAQPEVAKRLSVGVSTVGKLWLLGKKYIVDGMLPDPSVIYSKNYLRNTRSKYPLDELQRAIEKIPPIKRTSIRSMAGELKLPKSTVHFYNKILYSRITSAVKPVLTMENCSKRILYAIEHIGEDDKYQNFHNTVFIDEKWFRCTKASVKYYLTPDEDVPDRHVCNKRNIEKVMFLCAITRPRYDYHKKKEYDGKIGIFPITSVAPAKRSSKY
jgi:hypothetical protein